jgi:hypothetical protein
MSAVIGCIMVALAVLGLTAQVAYCLGEKRGMKDKKTRPASPEHPDIRPDTCPD